MYPQVTQFETRDLVVREWSELRELGRAAKAPRRQRRGLTATALFHALARRGQPAGPASA